MNVKILKSTPDALVRFQVQPLNNVCLEIIVATLYLCSQMQREIVHVRINVMILTYLLSQIESDHLLVILIEIPSIIDGLSILDIVVWCKLEVFLEFHRLQPILI